LYWNNTDCPESNSNLKPGVSPVLLSPVLLLLSLASASLIHHNCHLKQSLIYFKF
jgi:hypothetical protein